MDGEKIELTIRKAVPKDAEQLSLFLKKVEEELSTVAFLNTEDFSDTAEQEKHLAAVYESSNNLVILAFDGTEVIGIVSINGSSHPMTNHIGELGIVVQKNYQSMGLGTILVEEALEWAEETELLKRIELQVQVRNKKAVGLYEKIGFDHEGILRRGVKVGGTLLDVHQMSMLL